MHDLIAVFDVGKTNTKLSLIDAATGEPVRSLRRPNRTVEASGMRHLDLEGMQRWLLEHLRSMPERHRITAFVPVAHGAACVLLDASGEVLAAPDYEDPAFHASAAAYGPERDPFAATLSPRLPDGQNLGAQLYFLENHRPELFARAAHLLLLPQFWAWRLCGVMASEISSLGAHSDLWLPMGGDYSGLARRRGWADRFPPRRAAMEALGLLRPEIAEATGIPATCLVFCGVHDSNASWLWHLRKVRAGEDLTVISSGTWTIAMKSGADLGRLREERDMLANVDVFGSPVATARFMGGREYAAIAGAGEAKPTLAAVERLMAAGAMALPAFAEAGGPFHGRRGTLLGADGLDAVERAALASLYVALVTDLMLDLLGSSSTVVIDGPFAKNPVFAPILKALRQEDNVALCPQASGATAGALALVLGDQAPGDMGYRPVSAAHLAMLAGYRADWRARCGEK